MWSFTIDVCVHESFFARLQVTRQWKQLKIRHYIKKHESGLSIGFLCEMQTTFITTSLLQNCICLLLCLCWAGAASPLLVWATADAIPARSNLLCFINLQSMFGEHFSCLRLFEPFSSPAWGTSKNFKDKSFPYLQQFLTEEKKKGKKIIHKRSCCL